MDAIRQPRDKFIKTAVYSVNDKLQTIDSRWSTITSKDQLMYGDNDLYMTWTYPVPGTDIPRLEADIKAAQNDLIPVLDYLTPYSTQFFQNEKDLSTVAQLISHKKNSLHGYDTIYQMGQLIFTYSTFPPRPNGPSVNGRSAWVYKISITHS